MKYELSSIFIDSRRNGGGSPVMDMVKMGANVLGGGSKDGAGDNGGSNAMMNVLKMGKSFSDMMNAKGKSIGRSSL